MRLRHRFHRPTTAPRLECAIDLADLGHRIADDGIDDHAVDVAAAASLARSLGVDSPAIAVLVDLREPRVARERAFANVSAAIGRLV